MARLVVALVVLVIVLIARLIYWLVERSASPPSVRMQSFHHGPLPGQYPGGGGYARPPQGAPGWPQQGPSAYPQQGPSAYPQQGPSAYPQQGPSGWPQQGAPALPPAGAVRLVARPEHNFDRLSDCMSRAGLRVAVPPGQAVQPGEPQSAIWQNDAAQVRYTFDPRTYLRSLEITGPGAEQLRHGLVSMAGLAALDGPQILQLLQTPRPGDQLLGLAAAEYLGPRPDTQVYAGQVAALAGSPQPEIAQAAYRAQQRLQYGM